MSQCEDGPDVDDYGTEIATDRYEFGAFHMLFADAGDGVLTGAARFDSAVHEAEFGAHAERGQSGVTRAAPVRRHSVAVAVRDGDGNGTSHANSALDEVTRAARTLAAGGGESDGVPRRTSDVNARTSMPAPR